MKKTLRLISESVGGEISKHETRNGRLYIEGIFTRANIINENGHYYPKEMMVESVGRYIDEYVKKNRAIGELNHPPSLMVNPKEACIKIESLEWDGDAVIGRAMVMDELPNGKIVKGLIDSGVSIGVSTRGGGNIVDDPEIGAARVTDDFELVAIDVVTDPAVPDAFVSGVYQSKVFEFDGNTFKYVKDAEDDNKDSVDIVKAIMDAVRFK